MSPESEGLTQRKIFHAHYYNIGRQTKAIERDRRYNETDYNSIYEEMKPLSERNNSALLLIDLHRDQGYPEYLINRIENYLEQDWGNILGEEGFEASIKELFGFPREILLEIIDKFKDFNNEFF